MLLRRAAQRIHGRLATNKLILRLRSASNPLHRKFIPEKLRRWSTSVHARVLASLFGAGVTVSGAYAAYRTERGPEEDLIEADDAPEFAPPGEIAHPYNERSVFWQVAFKMHRAAYFCILFAPCVMAGLLAKITEDPALRAAWIRLLVKTIEMGGSSCMKFGQWISMRPDVIAGDIIQALAKLRQDAPSHPFEHTRRQIEMSFGKKIEDIFEDFSEEPVASGTIAQVHRARLRPEYALKNKDGKVIRYVAVKVQHPGVLAETFVDIDILFNGFGFLFAVPFSKQEFVEGMQRQINFEWEAYNLRKFSNNFRDEIKEGIVKFPDVSVDLLSPSVLVESWANGRTVANFFTTLEGGITDVGEGIVSSAKQLSQTMADALDDTKKDLARKIFGMNMKMFLRDNLVHSDMHAGNILFSEETEELTVLDAGQTASLLPDVAPKFGNFLHSICTRDRGGVYSNLLEFDEYKGERIADLDDFRDDVNRTMDKYCPEGEPIIVGDIMGQLFFTLQRHNVTMRSDVSVSIMSMAVSEGLIRSLDPEFDMVGAAMPYIAKYGTFGCA
mmetsp:Transcript_18422/g.45213  ORF Transcript_18422/g.45213 Transcript_18422/m.45213 type:complete len:557 (-) Transcript_18422:69-1739(-)